MPCNGPPMTTLTYCTLGAAARCFLHVRNMSFSKEHVILGGTCHSPRNMSLSKEHVILQGMCHSPRNMSSKEHVILQGTCHSPRDMSFLHGVLIYLLSYGLDVYSSHTNSGQSFLRDCIQQHRN
jgi:hypothetical protein